MKAFRLLFFIVEFFKVVLINCKIQATRWQRALKIINIRTICLVFMFSGELYAASASLAPNSIANEYFRYGLVSGFFVAAIMSILLCLSSSIIKFFAFVSNIVFQIFNQLFCVIFKRRIVFVKEPIRDAKASNQPNYKGSNCNCICKTVWNSLVPIQIYRLENLIC